LSAFHSPGNFYVNEGEECTYLWNVTEKAGPGIGPQFSTNAWFYSSENFFNIHMDDSYAKSKGKDYDDSSLLGPIIVVDPKAICSDLDAELATACDVDEEYVLYLLESDETASR